MHYRLKTDGSKLRAFLDQVEGPGLDVFAGSSWAPEPELLPYVFSVNNPRRAPLPDYISGDGLMSRRLVAALQAAGVDNLQVFDAQLRDEAGGEPDQSYCVVNIVGLVAAADLSKSASLPLAQGHVFTRLTVDPARAQGLPMFRLAESLIDVIVSEPVARAIEAGAFHGLTLTPVTPPDPDSPSGAAR